MNSTTATALEALTTPSGVMCVLALDHRDAMRNVFARAGIDATDTAMLEAKSRIVETLAGSASAIMLDPRAVERCRSQGIGLIMPLEEQGHQSLQGGRLTRLDEDFGPAQAHAVGADACKLLLYYRDDHPPTAALQRELLRDVAERCQRYDLPLIVEPIVYRLQGEDDADYVARFSELVAAAACAGADAGADLLKLQFPGDAQGCERLSEAAAPLHWTLLGGRDVDGDVFAEQLRLACRSGATGFMAGRAMWAGAIALPDDQQAGWLRREALPLFNRLNEIAHTYARRIQ